MSGKLNYQQNNRPSNHLESTISSPPNRPPLSRSPLNRSPTNPKSTIQPLANQLNSAAYHNNNNEMNEKIERSTDNGSNEKLNDNLNETATDQINYPNQNVNHQIQQIEPNDKSIDSRSAVLKSNDDESSNDNKSAETNEKGGKAKDSPAFRLRARRSTPRKLDSIYSTYSTSRRTSLYSPNSSERLQAKVAKLKNSSSVSDVKRNLFDSDKQIRKERRPNSPSRSLVEDVDLNVFAENILVEKLTEGKNNLNYLCLRIIEVLEEAGDECPTTNDSSNRNDCSSLNHCSPTTSSIHTNHRLLKIYCQQAETKSVLNVQKPVVFLYLFDEYVNFKNQFVPGKLLEIVKFEIKQLPKQPPPAYRHNCIEIAVHPFYIEVRANRPLNWIPLISIKKKYEPTNLSLLNVINTQNKYQTHDNIEDQPPTKSTMRFSSYVVKTEPTEQLNNSNLQNTNSPTIKRFMRTINKSYAQDSKLKLKIKREKS